MTAAGPRHSSVRHRPPTPLENTMNPPESRRDTRLRGDRGEGIISVAIAVLIMAFLGAAMWIAFSDIWSDTESNTRDQVEIIGS